MILNQGQLSIVVSDWESCLGSLFSFSHLWVVFFVSGRFSHTELHVRFVVYGFVGDICNKKMYAYHAAPWSGQFQYDARDKWNRAKTNSPTEKQVTVIVKSTTPSTCFPFDHIEVLAGSLPTDDLHNQCVL
jgi:hypothetical protein